MGAPVGWLGRVASAAQNAVEMARFGGLDAKVEPTPHAVLAQLDFARLRHYPGGGQGGPPVLLLPPLMMTAEVWDVSPATSAVRALAERGVDPWVVDFGSPEHEEGGLARTLTAHVLAVDAAISEVAAHTGRDVHVAGYSQGGMFAYQAAAYRRSEGVASLVTFGSPVDVHRGVPLGLEADSATRLAAALVRTLFAGSAVPGWMTRTGFKLLDPVKTVRSRVDFLRQLHDRETLLEREPQRRFLAGEGFIAWPGPALAEFTEQFVAHNRMLSGGFVIGDRMVTLADLDVPVLVFVGEVDDIARPATVRAITSAAPRAEVYELSVPTGHFGLVVGSRASATTWPAVAGWVAWREGTGPLPEGVAAVAPQAGQAAPARVGPVGALGVAANVGVEAARGAVRAAGDAARTARGVASGALTALPRLARLERARADDRVSLAALLDEQARRAPDDTFFLFEGRGHSWAAAKARIDAVARGLMASGVRHGQHVGVLMGTRPSALAAVAALNRVGAVAVLLRPGADAARERGLGRAEAILADPEHLEAARAAGAGVVLILGGGGAPGELPPDVVDLERIDPAAVDAPRWYRANPGRARDPAFVLFSGEGERTRAQVVTNRRWALSALGTASAAVLDRRDTLYCVTPLHHASTLLTSLGGAVAGGARLGFTRAFDPATFWDEVRRYGVTVVAYTWTQCRALADGPVDPAMPHHPVRLFVGAGMPAPLWRRVVARCAPARVLELYAATEGDLVLANVSGGKVGAKGRSLPGSAEVAVVRCDLATGRVVTGEGGFGERCEDGEVGLLLGRVGAEGARIAAPLRSVLAAGDTWMATGDLFHRDADGDHWWDGALDDVIQTAEGPVPPVPVEDAVGALPGVGLAVAYGLPLPGGRDALAVAVALLDRGRLEPRALAAATDALPRGARPLLVHVVDELPLTAWHRPRKGPLRAAGVPGPGTPAWSWDRGTRRYRRLSVATRRALGG